jgi:hypothetical protein
MKAWTVTHSGVLLQKFYTENVLLSYLVALQKSAFSHGGGGKDRKQDRPARNFTIVAKVFRKWFI